MCIIWENNCIRADLKYARIILHLQVVFNSENILVVDKQNLVINKNFKPFSATTSESKKITCRLMSFKFD